MTQVPCPLCEKKDFEIIAEGSDYEYYLPGKFYISKCKKCGLLSQNPRPPFSEIMKHYTEKYEPYKKVGSTFMQWLRYLALTRPQVLKIKKLVREKGLPRRACGETGKILDVGCATGNFLLELKKWTNYEVYGLEPKKEAAEIGQKAGLNIKITTLEKANLKPESFDLIIMNHVLEHVPNPDELTKIVFTLLKKGGYFIGHLPCSDCLERLIFKKYWQGYHLPRHLTWFSRKQLKKFLEKYGFVEVKCHLEPQMSNWQVSLRNYLYAKGCDKSKIKLLSGHNPFLYFLSAPFCLFFLLFKSGPIQSFRGRKP